MKRLVSTAALIFLCSLLVPPSASARFGDSARGKGETVSAERFSFSAEGFGGAGSIGATGTWKHTFTLGTNRTFEGNVFCLVVAGNQAIFAVAVTKSPGGAGFAVVTVEDNDGAGADRYGVRFPASGADVDCTVPGLTNPIVRGKIEVVASTFPT